MNNFANLPESFQAGRLRLSQDHPYLSSVLYRLFPVAKPGLGTMAVDEWYRLYFDPKCEWTPAQFSTVLYHEVGHLLRGHCDRAKMFQELDHNAWNICADAEINDDIQREGKATWPFPPVYPKDLNQKDGLLAEEYYANLPNVAITITSPGPGRGKCGSCSGNPIDGELPGPSGKDGEIPGVTPVERDLIAHRVAQDVKEHVKSRGNVPGWLQRWAEDVLNPKVDWRKVLAGMVKHYMADVAGMVDFSYRRPSRRQIPNVILPSLRRPIPQIAMVLDTSGSMSEQDLTDSLAEVKGVLRGTGCADVDAIIADADVKSSKRVRSASQISLTGGGGTDMRVGIDYALKRQPRPHVIIVLTDGYTPWPDNPIGVKVIAAIVGKNARDVKGVPNWIRRVNVDD